MKGRLGEEGERKGGGKEKEKVRAVLVVFVMK